MNIITAPRIALFLTSASALAWSVATEAQLYPRERSEYKPTIEVHLEALRQLRTTPTNVAKPAPVQSQHMPFTSKTPADYASAPSIQRAPAPTPTPAPATITFQAMPWQSTPAIITPPRVSAVQKPISNNPPVDTTPAHQRRAVNAAQPIVVPPALPYGAGHAAPPPPHTDREDSSWWDDTTDYVGDMLDFSGDDEPRQAQASPQPAAPAPQPITHKPLNQPIADASSPAALPTERSVSVGNAATYDGWELAQGLADQTAYDTARKSSPNAGYTPSSPSNIPLPKPTSPDTEILLAEVSDDAPTASPTPVQAAPTPTPKKAKKHDIGKLIIPPPSPAEPVAVNTPKPAQPSTPKAAPAPRSNLNETPTTVTKKVAPTPPASPEPVKSNQEQPWFDGLKKDLDNYFEDEKEAQEESKQASNSKTTPTVAPIKLEDESSFLPPPPPPPAPAAPAKAKEETTKAKAPTIKDTPKPAPAPTKKPAAPIKTKAAEKSTTPPPPPTAATNAKKETVAKKPATKTSAVAKPAAKPVAEPPKVAAPKKPALAKLPAEPTPSKAPAKPKTSLPALSKLTGDPATIQENATRKVEEVKPLPKLSDVGKTVAKTPKKATNVPPPPPPPVIAKAKEKVQKETQAAAKTIPPVTISPSNPVDATPADSAPKKEVVLTREDKADDKPVQVASLPSTNQSTNISSSKIRFNNNETDLTAAMQKQLNSIAENLKTSDTKRLTIRAFAAAEKGQEVLARKIALRRGLSVRAYLIEQGVSALRINIESKGNTGGANTPDEVVLDLKDLSGA